MVMFNDDIEVYPGTTLKWVFYALNNDQTALNISTGCSVQMFIRVAMSNSSSVVLNCTPYLDLHSYGATGIILLSIPYNISKNISNGYYDLKLKNSDGEVYILSKGKVKVNSTPTDWID